MALTTIYAVLMNGHTDTEIKRIRLCRVQLDDGRMSANRYNRLKRQMREVVENPPRAHYWTLLTEDGRRDTFGGYPAFGYITFEEEKPLDLGYTALPQTVRIDYPYPDAPGFYVLVVPDPAQGITYRDFYLCRTGYGTIEHMFGTNVDDMRSIVALAIGNVESYKNNPDFYD